jgi:hypothetical protein
VCGDFAWCILHLDFPKGNDPEFTRIRDEKLLKTKEKIKAGDLNFEGTNIYDVDASDVSIPGQNNAIFYSAHSTAHAYDDPRLMYIEHSYDVRR